MEELKNILHEGGWSCVIRGGDGAVRTFSQRGVADLYRLLTEEPEMLRGASVADKVVGKGVAALMALGGVAEVYADVVSTPALELLRAAGITVSFGFETPNIVNRDRTGWCPVEKLCAGADSPEECLPLIEEFINSKKR